MGWGWGSEWWWWGGLRCDLGDTRPHNLQVEADGETVAFVLFLPGCVQPRQTVVGVDLR